MNFSYTMGLCMMSLGEAIDCLTAQSDLSTYTNFFCIDYIIFIFM